MSSEEFIYLRDQIREARAATLKDAEAFTEALFAVERLGSYLCRVIGTLGTYKGEICKLAGASPLAEEIPVAHPQQHVYFSRLYEMVMQARNDALHQGAYARHLTSQVIELTIVLEDALMTSFLTVSEYMVRNPVSASLWQPLSFIRQQMLVNSFSFLPVIDLSGVWCFISDLELARYLRVKAGARRIRLAETLEAAVSSGGIDLLQAETVGPNENVETVAARLGQAPLLVTAGGQLKRDLVGIITAFDLL